MMVKVQAAGIAPVLVVPRILLLMRRQEQIWYVLMVRVQILIGQPMASLLLPKYPKNIMLLSQIEIINRSNKVSEEQEIR
jgi:hypothetical protein